jgi:hypothetical protein
LSDAFYEGKDFKNAVRVLPFHTEALQELLYSTTNVEEQLKYANLTLKYNKNVSGAYEAIRNEFVKDNKFMEAIEIEEKRVALNKYDMYSYLLYAKLLSDGIAYYEKNEDKDKVEIILSKVVNIEKMIKDTIDKTNPLCYKTIHVPELEIGDELRRFIDGAKERLQITNVL